MLILPKITVLAPNGFSLKIAPKTTFNTKSFEIRPIGATCTSIRPVYNGWLVDSETNFLKLPAPITAAGPPRTDFTVGRRWPTAPVLFPHRTTLRRLGLSELVNVI